MEMRLRSHSGFTLVELSIVLVILGLLVGGVLSGQSLIRAAQLRSVSTQYQNYISAVNSFRDKYFALPGDLTTATSFWTARDGNAATCGATASTDKATCNGNGDGIILPIMSGSTLTGSNEAYRFWQHLANAGLIEGSYSGVTGGASNQFTSIAANAPAGKLSSSLWLAYGWGTKGASTTLFAGEYGNSLALGAMVSGDWGRGAILKPEELWNIDTKLDDGKPAIGKVRVYVSNAVLTSCTNTTDGANLAAEYAVSSSTIACAVIFAEAF